MTCELSTHTGAGPFPLVGRRTWGFPSLLLLSPLVGGMCISETPVGPNRGIIWSCVGSLGYSALDPSPSRILTFLSSTWTQFLFLLHQDPCFFHGCVHQMGNRHQDVHHGWSYCCSHVSEMRERRRFQSVGKLFQVAPIRTRGESCVKRFSVPWVSYQDLVTRQDKALRMLVSETVTWVHSI